MSIAGAARCPVPLSSTALGGSDRVYWYPQYIPSDVSSLQLQVGNRMFNGGVGSSFTSDIALYTADASGLPTGAALGSWPAQTIPGDGTVLTLPATPVVRGTTGKVVALIGMPGTATVAISLNGVTFGSYKLGSTAVNPAPTPDGTNTTPVLDVNFKFTTSRPGASIWGDSISNGYSTGSAVGFEATCFYEFGVENDWSIDTIGVVQYGSLQNFALAAGTGPLFDLMDCTDKDVVIQVVENDLLYNDLPTMQSSLLTNISIARSKGARRVFAFTGAPQLGYPGTEAARTGYNAWLLTQVSAGVLLDGIIDTAQSQATGGLADPANSTVLYAPFDSGDGTHWSAAGHDQVKLLLAAALSPPVTVSSAVAIAVNTVRVTFDGDVSDVSPIGVGDALNPASWAITRTDTGASYDVMSVSSADGTARVFDVVIYERFASSLVHHQVDAAGVLDGTGAAVQDPTTATFVGVVADTHDTQDARAAANRYVVTDIANPPTPLRSNNGGGGTRVTTAGGDFASESGNQLLRKLIVRRLTTSLGGFFHLPDYGVGLAVKEPIRTSDVTALRARIMAQVALEPEVVAVNARVAIDQANGVLSVELAVRTNTGEAFVVSVPQQQDT